MVAAIQLLFVGKVRRKKGNFIPKQLMTVWVNNMKKRGRPITTNKTSIIKYLQQLYPPNVYYTDIFGTQIAENDIFMDRFGSFQYWLEDAMEEKK